MPTSPLGSEYRDGAIRVVPEADDILTVCLEGEFDLRSAPMLGEELDRGLESKKDLILDLSQATFVDSSVIQTLFRATRALHGRGQVAVLQLGTTPIVERALEIAGIECVLLRAHSRSEAIEIIRRGTAASPPA